MEKEEREIAERLEAATNLDVYKRQVYYQGEQAGWLTTTMSRPAALGRLDAGMVEQPERFQSRRLLAECRSFVRLPNGGCGARPGTCLLYTSRCV